MKLPNAIIGVITIISSERGLPLSRYIAPAIMIGATSMIQGNSFFCRSLGRFGALNRVPG
jgi:hypothetical protein